MTYETFKSTHPRYLVSRIGDSNADVLNDIQDASTANCFTISMGFPAAYAKPFDNGGIPLNRSEFNSILNLLTQLHFYWQLGGVPLWDSRIASGEDMYESINGYPANARVYHMVDSQLTEFVSMHDNNSVEPKKNDPDNWKVITLGSDAVTETRLQEVSGYLSSYTTTRCDTLSSRVDILSNFLNTKVDTLSGNAKTVDDLLGSRIAELSSRTNKVLDVTSDKTTVEEILEETGHGSETFRTGDILIVTGSDAENEYKSAYVHDESDWVACTGNVDASKVLISTSLDLAGNYTSIGNLSKTSTGTVVKNQFPKGTSIQQIITDMIDKVVQPSIDSVPKNSITLRNGSSSGTIAGEVEVGSKFTPYFSITFTDGQFACAGSKTNAGCAETSWSVTDIVGSSSSEKSGSIYSEFTVGDGTKVDETEVGVKGYKVSSITTYGKSNYAKNNKGTETTLYIPASSTASVSSTAVTGIRHMFWGMDTGTGNIDSSTIRSLGHQKKPVAGTLPTLESSEKTGAKRCIIAIPSTSTLTRTLVKIPISMGAEITDLFVQQSSQIIVEGLNGYPGIGYNVWVYHPASIGEGENYDITIG